MKKYAVQKIVALFFLAFVFIATPFTLKSQICNNYLLVPDTVFVNSPAFLEVQQNNGSSTPPTLWICNWIDFEANGSHECTNVSSCQYSFSSGGLIPVQVEINEPFLNNTEVCTYYVYVNACDAPSLVAKANNVADTAFVCEGTQLQLASTPSGGQSCTGDWQYAWFNGNTYYDGNDFLSFGEVWNSSFQNATFNDINTNRLFTVKVRCSAFPNCIDSSKVYVSVKNFIQNPVFNPLPDSSRCQGIDTLYVSAHESNADSIIYMIDQSSLAAGNQINVHNGVLIFDSLFHGTTSITATAYGCDGPKSVTQQILTHPVPDVAFLASDSTFMCLGDTLFLPLVFNGSAPFDLKYNFGTFTEYIYSTSLFNDHLPVIINDSDLVVNFYKLNDFYCTRNFDIKQWIFSSPKPVFSALMDTTLCADASITLDLGTGAYQYLWSHDNSISNTALIDTSLVNIGMGSNIIYVSITDNHCTVVDSANITFTICSFDNSLQNTSLQITIFPNPANTLFYIDAGSIAERKMEVEVYTPSGQLILSEKGNVDLNNPFPLKINKQGLYFIKCKVQGYSPVLKKVIIY